MLRFSLFKVPISVHWMFLLLAAFLGGALRSSSPAQWHQVLLFIVAAFVSILTHEFGHVLAGLKLGGRNPQIQLHSMGGLAFFGYSRFNAKQRIVMIAAGPFASILLAVTFKAIEYLTFPYLAHTNYAHVLFAIFVLIMVQINTTWAIINLLPALPMDGGQIVMSALGPQRLKLTCIISFVTIALLATALWFWTHSIYNLVIMLFLASYTWNLYKTANQRGL